MLSKFDDPWRHFLVFADEYNSVREEAVERIRSSGEVPSCVEVLDFLGRVQPKGKLLLDCCLACVRGQAVGWDVVHKAAELLGRDFAGDNDALQKLLEGSGPDWLPLPTVFALCEGWPDSQRFSDQCKRFVRYRFDVGWEFRIALRCACGTSDQVLRELIKILRWKYVPHLRFVYERFSWLLLKRVKRDEPLQSLLTAKLRAAPTPNEKCTISRLLGSACGVDSDLRTWCLQEVEKQLGGSQLPEVGLDLLDGSVRPVVEVLSDLLEPSVSM